MRRFLALLACMFLICTVFFGCGGGDDNDNDNHGLTVEITSPLDGATISFPQTIAARVTTEDSITGVVFYAAGESLTTDTVTPYSGIWSVADTSGAVDIIVCAHTAFAHSCDTISITVPTVIPYDFRMSQLAVGSRKAFVAWIKSDFQFFLKYRVYMANNADVDSFDTRVFELSNRKNDTTAFVSNLSPNQTYYFRAYAYSQTGDVKSSNVLAIATTSSPSTHNDGAELVNVPAGYCNMGDIELDSYAQPPHVVSLNGFKIYKNEVTCAQFAQFIDADGYNNPDWWDSTGWMFKYSSGLTSPNVLYWNASDFPAGSAYPTYPVVGISWYEACAYANFVGRRLPTEAEWECAAKGRADTTSDGTPDGYRFPWGNVFYVSGTVHCNYNSGSLDPGYNDGFAKTSPVGNYSGYASPFGCEDMSGNAVEWCSDWFDPLYYSSSPSNNPQGPTTGTEKVVRGGSWIMPSDPAMNGGGYYMRAALRNKLQPDKRFNYIGFRLVEPM